MLLRGRVGLSSMRKTQDFLQVRLRAAHPEERRGPLSALRRHRLAKGVILRQADDRVSPAIAVPRININHRIAFYFDETWRVGGDDRATPRHSFQHRDTESF